MTRSTNHVEILDVNGVRTVIDPAEVAARLAIDSGWHIYHCMVRRSANDKVIVTGEVLHPTTGATADELRSAIRALQQQLAKMEPRRHE